MFLGMFLKESIHPQSCACFGMFALSLRWWSVSLWSLQNPSRDEQSAISTLLYLYFSKTLLLILLCIQFSCNFPGHVVQLDEKVSDNENGTVVHGQLQQSCSCPFFYKQNNRLHKHLILLVHFFGAQRRFRQPEKKLRETAAVRRVKTRQCMFFHRFLLPPPPRKKQQRESDPKMYRCARCVAARDVAALPGLPPKNPRKKKEPTARWGNNRHGLGGGDEPGTTEGAERRGVQKKAPLGEGVNLSPRVLYASN